MWSSRGLLLTGYEHLSPKRRVRFAAALSAEDPINEIAAAHAVKERLLLSESEPHLIRHRLFQISAAAARAEMDVTTSLARTIDTWWPAVLVALTEDVTNARTEGFNHIKQPNGSGAGSPTWTITEGAAWSTSPSPEGAEQQHESSTHPPMPIATYLALADEPEILEAV